ncbi:MAG: MurT ligase domain-containing protein [Solirubrobacteraceae bacterium]
MRLALARAAAALSRRSGRGGTSLPGKLLLRMDSRAIARLSARLPLGSVAISATNGKTTTATMAAAILERDGKRLVHNSAGANMAGGIASALLAASGDLGLFEVDEFYLPAVVAQLEPRAIVLGNLFRDQLDRYGELEAIADRWAALLSGSSARLVLNADDPLIAGLGPALRGGDAVPPLYFGIEDPAMARSGLSHASDSKHCRRCGAPFRYERVYLGHLGVYRCPNGHAGRPAPDVSAHEIELRGVRSASFTLRVPGTPGRRVELPLPGLYNVYNALAAAALCSVLGVSLDGIAAGLESSVPAFGRAESIALAGHELRIMLIKNPTGANEVLRTLALEPGEHHLIAALNDGAADGRDVSWIWDADWETLAPRIGYATCTGKRAPELALRLKYAGVPTERITVESRLERALDDALSRARTTLYALPTYTAMLELRSVLVDRGQAGSSWL